MVGSSTFTGIKADSLYIINKVDSLTEETDTASYYFKAFIDDTTLYEEIIDTLVSQEFVDASTDSIVINSLIEKIRFENLSPFLEYDSTEVTGNNNYKKTQNSLLPIESVTKIYPNPTENLLIIDLGSDYILEQPKSIIIYNNIGQIMNKEYLRNNTRKNKIDLSKLSPGIYILEINQNQKCQRTKFIKNSP